MAADKVIASTRCPASAYTIAVPAKNQSMGSPAVSCASSSQGLPGTSIMSFTPYSALLRIASDVERPRSNGISGCCRTSGRVRLRIARFYPFPYGLNRVVLAGPGLRVLNAYESRPLIRSQSSRPFILTSVKRPLSLFPFRSRVSFPSDRSPSINRYVPLSQIITSPAPYIPSGMNPSKDA
jgi:hypothetical protein